jgi:hypothetical protein
MSKILELAKRIASTGGLETKTTETISGTYDSTGQQRLLSHAYTIGANLTITNGELILSRLADNGTGMTVEFGSDVTLSGDGTLMLGDLGQGQQNLDASKLTGVLGSGVTVPAAGITGTLGSGVTLDHDAQKYSWSRYIDSDTNYSSDATIDFQQAEFMGSGVTESGGVITIDSNGGGLYLISACTHNHTNTVNAHQWKIRVNGVVIDSPSMYTNWNATTSPHVHYYASAGTLTIPVRLSNSATVEIYGKGYVTSNPDASYFNGIRIGGKTY